MTEHANGGPSSKPPISSQLFVAAAKEESANCHPAWLIETLDEYHKNTSDAENIAQFLDSMWVSGEVHDWAIFTSAVPATHYQSRDTDEQLRPH
jgi:hypothetical protein